MLDSPMIKFLEILSNPQYALFFLALSIWILAWKGVALWKASQNNQRNWFIVLLVVNSLGILEIMYLFYLQKKREVKNVDSLPKT